jgi:hypothetical protein
VPAVAATLALLEARQGHADDVQPSREPVEGEGADLVRAGAECVPVGAFAVGWRERLRDGRQQIAQALADVVGEPRVPADRIAQIPRAVADVALLVVVDLAVARDEAG